MAEWIDLLDPSEQELDDALPPEVHERMLGVLLRRAIHDDEPRPRLEGHADYIFGIFLVTVRKTPERGYPFDDRGVRESVEAAGETDVGTMAYRLVDAIAEYFLDLVDALDAEIDELEDGIEQWQSAQIRGRISALRHDLLHVRRVLTPMRDAVRRVVDKRVELAGGTEIFPRERELDFADVYDKILRAVDGLDLSRDLLASARDYHQAKIANDQNEVMKVLTVIASVLLLPTFIVGLYGQNFRHIPELGWGFGYWWAWAWILVTTAIQLAFFRWRGWIGGDPLGRPKLPPLRTLDPRQLRQLRLGRRR